MKVARSRSLRQNAIDRLPEMNPSDIQSESEPRYFDPEELDMSEEQFAASLEISICEAKPQFVIDDVLAEGRGDDCHAINSASAAPSEPSIADSFGKLRALETQEAYEGTTPENASRPAQQPDADWRDQVSAKVNHYKARKPRQERYPSLKLQFSDTPPQRKREAEPFTEGTAQKPKAQAAEPIEPNFSPPPFPDSPPRIFLEATARVLEFPRPAARAEELADPVMNRPRIVEAPELLPPPPAMGGILIEQQAEPEPERRPGFDVPLQPAPLGRRVVAGGFDAVLVILAIAIFGYVVVRINGTVPPLRSAAWFAVGLMGALWPAYQYVFLVFSGRTPGLWLTRLHLNRFDGQRVSRSLRRWRVLASVLSFAPLGLGYAWCLLDEDQLTWHDRITRTHLGPLASGKIPTSATIFL